VKTGFQTASIPSRLWRCVFSLVVLLLISVHAPHLSAQSARPSEQRWEVFEQLGGSFFTFTKSRTVTIISLPSGSVRTFRDDTSYPARARLFTGVRFHVTPNNHIELSYSYTALRRQTDLFGPFSNSPVSVFDSLGSHITSLNYVRNLWGRGRLQPFVTGGLGIAAITSNGCCTYGTLAGNVGAGLDVQLKKVLSLRMENRVYLRRLGELNSRQIVTNVAPSVGLVFHF